MQQPSLLAPLLPRGGGGNSSGVQPPRATLQVERLNNNADAAALGNSRGTSRTPTHASLPPPNRYEQSAILTDVARIGYARVKVDGRIGQIAQFDPTDPEPQLKLSFADGSGDWFNLGAVEETTEEGIQLSNSILPELCEECPFVGPESEFRCKQAQGHTFIGYLPNSQHWITHRASKLHSNATVQEQVLDKIAGRGFLLGAVLDLLCLLLDRDRALKEIPGLQEALKEHGDLSNFPNDLPDCSFFDPHTSTTADVAYWAIIPMTASKKSALATILNGGRECYPTCIISHTWQNVFTHTIAAAVADAVGVGYYFHIVPRLKTFDRVRELAAELNEKLLRSYWICAISVNQHTVLCNRTLVHVSDPLIRKMRVPGRRNISFGCIACSCGCEKVLDGERSEIGAFDQMMDRLRNVHPDFYQLLAVDKGTVQYVELPCATGFDVGRRTGHITSIRTGGALHAWNCNKPSWQPDVRVGDRVLALDGEVVDGEDGYKPKVLTQCTKRNVRLLVQRAASVLTRVWVLAELNKAQRAGMRQQVIVHFPFTLTPANLSLVRNIDVRTCEASLESDKALILQRIPDFEKFNGNIRESLLREFGRQMDFMSGFELASCALRVVPLLALLCCAVCLSWLSMQFTIRLVLVMMYMVLPHIWTLVLWLQNVPGPFWHFVGSCLGSDSGIPAGLTNLLVVMCVFAEMIILAPLYGTIMFTIAICLILWFSLCAAWVFCLRIFVNIWKPAYRRFLSCPVQLKYSWLIDEVSRCTSDARREVLHEALQYCKRGQTPWWFHLNGFRLVFDVDGVVQRVAENDKKVDDMLHEWIEFLVYGWLKSELVHFVAYGWLPVVVRFLGMVVLMGLRSLGDG